MIIILGSFALIVCVIEPQYLWAVFIGMFLFICDIIITNKEDEWRKISFLKDHLKKIGIDYLIFCKLSRKEQIELLKSTHDIDEGELNIEFYNPILKKK